MMIFEFDHFPALFISTYFDYKPFLCVHLYFWTIPSHERNNSKVQLFDDYQFNFLLHLNILIDHNKNHSKVHMILFHKIDVKIESRRKKS